MPTELGEQHESERAATHRFDAPEKAEFQAASHVPTGDGFQNLATPRSLCEVKEKLTFLHVSYESGLSGAPSRSCSEPAGPRIRAGLPEAEQLQSNTEAGKRPASPTQLWSDIDPADDVEEHARAHTRTIDGAFPGHSIGTSNEPEERETQEQGERDCKECNGTGKHVFLLNTDYPVCFGKGKESEAIVPAPVAALSQDVQEQLACLCGHRSQEAGQAAAGTLPAAHQPRGADNKFSFPLHMYNLMLECRIVYWLPGWRSDAIHIPVELFVGVDADHYKQVMGNDLGFDIMGKHVVSPSAKVPWFVKWLERAFKVTFCVRGGKEEPLNCKVCKGRGTLLASPCSSCKGTGKAEQRWLCGCLTCQYPNKEGFAECSKCRTARPQQDLKNIQPLMAFIVPKAHTDASKLAAAHVAVERKLGELRTNFGKTLEEQSVSARPEHASEAHCEE